MTIQLIDMTFFACYFYIEDRALSQTISYLCYPESADKHVFGRYFISFQSQRVKHVCKIVIDNYENVSLLPILLFSNVSSVLHIY